MQRVCHLLRAAIVLSILTAGCSSGPGSAGPADGATATGGVGGPSDAGSGGTGSGSGGNPENSGGQMGQAGAGAGGGVGGSAGGAVISCPTGAPACVLDARQCGSSGDPETCVADRDGCPVWQANEDCGPHQACGAGACACMDDARCGATPSEGDFCPISGSATFGHCAMDADGCFFVSAEGNACSGGETCDASGVVATGTACGCPANGGKLGMGCENMTVNATAADPANDAVLRCEAIGSCRIWRVLIDCGSQNLTAGTVNGTNGCVCKPASASTYYVDPAPPASTQMTGLATGTQFPPACRLGSLKAALDKVSGGSGFNRVVASHESASIHLSGATGESFPLTVPAGVTVTTIDGSNLDPAHYVVDIASVPAGQPAVVLGDGAVLSGFTLDAGGVSGPNAGTNVTSVVTCAETTKAQTATLDHVIIKSKSGQAGIFVRGACALGATQTGIYGADGGVDVARTATGATDMASLTATDLTVSSSAPSSFGVRVGTGLDAGARSAVTITGAIIATNGSGVVVAGGTATVSQAAITFAGSSAGMQNRGFRVSAGNATFDGSSVSQASVTGAGNAIGAEITGGVVILSGTQLTGGGHFTGVQVSNAGTVTIKGNSARPSKVTTTLDPTSTDASEGVVLLTGSTSTRLTVDGNTEVSGFYNGVVVNEGTLAIAGSGVTVRANRNHGVVILGRTPGPNVGLSGATIRDNAATGLVLRTIVPVTAQNCTITGNGGDGVNAQRTQTTPEIGQQGFVLSGSTVSGNAGRGIALTGQGVGTGVLAGGKVGARLTGNTVSSNADVGVLVTEASDNSDGDDVTEVWLESNDVGGNLTGPSATSVLAGGVFFASSDGSTRILLRTFLGNRVHGNGKAEIGFNLTQNDGMPWNLSSSATDPSALCGDAAQPNFVYCYDNYPGDMAIVVASSTVHLTVKGMHFQNAPALAGRDFTSTIPATEITAFCAPQACQ